jgi:hypothetical protein
VYTIGSWSPAELRLRGRRCWSAHDPQRTLSNLSLLFRVIQIKAYAMAPMVVAIAKVALVVVMLFDAYVAVRDCARHNINPEI